MTEGVASPDGDAMVLADVDGGPGSSPDVETTILADGASAELPPVQSDYEKVFGLYEDFALAIESIMKTCLENEVLSVHSIDHRAKSISSFGAKARRASEDDPNAPRYRWPLSEVTDLAGARVITYFLSTVGHIEPIIFSQFDVREKINRSQLLEEEEKLGYHSVHYVVALQGSKGWSLSFRSERFCSMLGQRSNTTSSTRLLLLFLRESDAVSCPSPGCWRLQIESFKLLKTKIFDFANRPGSPLRRAAYKTSRSPLML